MKANEKFKTIPIHDRIPRIHILSRIKSMVGSLINDTDTPKYRRTMKCTRVADRAFPDGEVTWPQPRDFGRSSKTNPSVKGYTLGNL
jgi:hypothetical protein